MQDLGRSFPPVIALYVALFLLCLEEFRGQSISDTRRAQTSQGENSRPVEQIDCDVSNGPACALLKKDRSQPSLTPRPSDGEEVTATPVERVAEAVRLEIIEDALTFRSRWAPSAAEHASPSSSSQTLRPSLLLRCPFEDSPDVSQATSYWRDVLTAGIKALERSDAPPSTREVFDALDAFGTMVHCCPGALVGGGESPSFSPESFSPPRSCGLLVFGDGGRRHGGGNAALGVGIMLNFSRALRLARLPNLSLSMLNTQLLMNIRHEPYRALWQREAAMALLQQGEVPKAVVALEKALEFDPQDLRTLQLLGASLLIQGSEAEGKPTTNASTVVRNTRFTPNHPFDSPLCCTCSTGHGSENLSTLELS